MWECNRFVIRAKFEFRAYYVQSGFHVAPPGRDCTSEFLLPLDSREMESKTARRSIFALLDAGDWYRGLLDVEEFAFGREGGGKKKEGFLKKARNSTLAGEWECRLRSNCFSELFFFSVHQLQAIKRLCAKRNLQQHFFPSFLSLILSLLTPYSMYARCGLLLK